MGILLVYDVTDSKSFGNIKNWIRNIEQHATESVNKILVGNKCDLEDKQVSKEQGQKLASEYGIKFLEASAKGNINVDEAFITLAKDIKARLIDNPESDEGKKTGESGTVNPSASGEDVKKGGCCK